MGQAALGHTGRCFIFIFFLELEPEGFCSPTGISAAGARNSFGKKGGGLALLPGLKGEKTFLASQAPLRKTRLQIALLPTEPLAHSTIHTTALGRKPGTGIAA